MLLLPTLPGEISAASPLRAGISVVEITPPVGTPLGGSERPRPAVKIHDPVFARILVLKTPETSVALVSSDLHRLQSPALVNRIRDELGKGDKLLSRTCKAHNHTYHVSSRQAGEFVVVAVSPHDTNHLVSDLVVAAK